MDNEEIIKAAVNKFLGWKLPGDFVPDAGISFTPEVIPSTPQTYEMPWPSGTNLFTAVQAEAMFRHCLTDALVAQAAEIEGLRKDAERLNALDEQKVTVNFGGSLKYGSGWYWFIPGSKLTNSYALKSIREAIDAAISENPTPESKP